MAIKFPSAAAIIYHYLLQIPEVPAGILGDLFEQTTINCLYTNPCFIIDIFILFIDILWKKSKFKFHSKAAN